MSRIGKQPIAIPEGAQVDIADGLVKVKGPKGNLERDFSALKVKLNKDNDISIEQADADSASWGLARALLANMVTGVTTGFTKTL